MPTWYRAYAYCSIFRNGGNLPPLRALFRSRVPRYNISMETIEDIYARMFNEHDTIQAANPWGCNQYGHRKGHQGSSATDSKKSGSKSTSDEKQGPAKLPNGAFNIPGLKKPLAVPTSNPGEKNAPILKPKDMSDKDFREALDLDNPYRSNPSKEKTSSIDNEVDEFEKASLDKRRDMLDNWKKKAKSSGEAGEKELFDKIRIIGKKRGWNKQKLDSTLDGIKKELDGSFGLTFV